MLVSLTGIRPAPSGVEGDSDLGIRRRRVTDAPIVIRTASARDADALHELIDEHLAEGHLLPRELGEVLVHAHRFVIAVQDDEVLACAELAPLSHAVAEVRSMVVTREARSRGVGRRIVNELVQRATAAGFEKVCAFTHSPGYFVHLGFSIVPHAWLPEKIVSDCHACSQFRRCGQYAVVRSLDRPRHKCVPLAALRG
jgi:N-acetylglutamate synthase-like GNAT family acetyltransferase